MLRPNLIASTRLRLLGALAVLWLAGCASEPPVMYPGPTPTTGYIDSDSGYSAYVDDGYYYSDPTLIGGGYYYAPYTPTVIAPGGTYAPPASPLSRPLNPGAPTFHPPGGSPAFKPASSPVSHSALKDVCVRIRNQGCR